MLTTMNTVYLTWGDVSAFSYNK